MVRPTPMLLLVVVVVVVWCVAAEMSSKELEQLKTVRDFKNIVHACSPLITQCGMYKENATVKHLSRKIQRCLCQSKVTIGEVNNCMGVVADSGWWQFKGNNTFLTMDEQQLRQRCHTRYF